MSALGKNEWLLFALLTALLLLIGSQFVFAGATGKITDAKTGEPLPAAEVVLTHLWGDGRVIELLPPRGASANRNGEFVILNVRPGKYTVQIRMILRILN
ncbi:MAG: hypothetical protein GWP06_13130 [Actinobacteria bacterium]|nr:hypothetical protein [Actinomycetota bacterium]